MLRLLSNNADCVLLYQHLAEVIDHNTHCDYCIGNGFGKNQVKIVLNSPKAAKTTGTVCIIALCNLAKLSSLMWPQ